MYDAARFNHFAIIDDIDSEYAKAGENNEI